MRGFATPFAARYPEHRCVAAILTTELIRDYLLNYGRSLIYTTTLTYANIIAVECAFDMLENGSAEVVSSVSQKFVGLLLT